MLIGQDASRNTIRRFVRTIIVIQIPHSRTEQIIHGHYTLDAPGILVADEREGGDKGEMDRIAALGLLEERGQLMTEVSIAGFVDTEITCRELHLAKVHHAVSPADEKVNLCRRR